MSDKSIHYDAVADGLPQRFDRVELLFFGAYAAFGLWSAHTGQWWEVADVLVFSILLYLIGATRRKYWVRGYEAAVQTTAEQIDADDPTDT